MYIVIGHSYLANAYKDSYNQIKSLYYDCIINGANYKM